MTVKLPAPAGLPAQAGGPRPGRAWLGLGSNVGDRWHWMAAMVGQLQESGVVVVARSSLYETEPMHVRDQAWFLNAVVEVMTEGDPLDLLRRCQAVETRLGRQRRIAMGPRTADIDLLLVEGHTRHDPSLTLPHPRLAERRFALQPLLELVPLARDPRSGRPYAEWMAALAEAPGQGLRRVAAPDGWGSISEVPHHPPRPPALR